MTAINISIGHDNEFMITKLYKVQCLRIFRCANRYAHCSKNVAYFFILIYLMLHRFLYIQYLTTQWKNSLITSLTSLFSSTAGRISLNQVQLTFFRIPLTAISKFSG